MQLRIDDSPAATYYSSTMRIVGSGEEIIVDFSQGGRPHRMTGYGSRTVI